MKKYLFCILSGCNLLTLSAQFSGGTGKGDHFSGQSFQTLNGETVTIYLGGNGRGDNQALVTEVFLSDDIQYFGGNGRGDVLASASLLSLGDDMRYSGGSGRGDGVSGFNGQVLSQRVLWRGGQSTGNETSSTRGSNWYPNGLPADTSEIALEANSNTYDLVLQGNLRIKSIDFNGANKKIVVGGYSLVITDKVTGANATNYIRTATPNACVRFFVPNNDFRLMPVGNAAYNPVTIANYTGVMDSFCVFVNDEVNANGLTGHPLWNIPRVKRTWYIGKGSGTSNLGNGVDFVFGYNSGEDSAISTMNLFHWNGNNWAVQTGGSASAGTFTFTGYKGGFSPFALGDGVSPLPVSWLDMRCARKGTQAVEVRWKTASEEGSQSFYIQRSTGAEFRDIDSIPAAGYSYEPKSYSYTDRAAPAGTLFYRIRQLDRDGRQSFSDVCATAQATANELRVMSNPADKEFRVWITDALAGAGYSIYNAAGQEVAAGILNSGMTAIPTATLPSGCYNFRIMNAENPFFTKVVVLHP
ncbi:MAG: T9SS type A sorting domain-containing protein [Bacteroidetes bacterium]|nr:T9SS type A sorting domain-containing protein [Bacteroidota bacterium]